MVLMFAMFFMPMIGAGPIWPTYATVMAPCNTYWWTVLLQINNLYPKNYDEKCMPWAWFLPALTQLSLVLPLVLFIYKKMMPNRNAIRLIFGFMIFAATAVCFFTTYYSNLGGLPFAIYPLQPNDPNQLNGLSFDYMNNVYMKPYFHLNTYLIGIVFALIYMRHVIDLRENNRDDTENIEISITSRAFVLFNQNPKVRYGGYLLGLIMITGAYAWLYPFYSNGPN